MCKIPFQIFINTKWSICKTLICFFFVILRQFFYDLLDSDNRFILNIHSAKRNIMSIYRRFIKKPLWKIQLSRLLSKISLSWCVVKTEIIVMVRLKYPLCDYIYSIGLYIRIYFCSRLCGVFVKILGIKGNWHVLVISLTEKIKLLWIFIEFSDIAFYF